MPTVGAIDVELKTEKILLLLVGLNNILFDKSHGTLWEYIVEV